MHAPWHLLYPRERLIVARQLRGDTLVAIGRDLGISKSRAAQLRNRGWFVLSAPSRLRRRRADTYAANPLAFERDPS